MATGRTLSAWTSESESSQVGFWFHRFVDLKQQLLDGCFMSTFRIRTRLQTQQACRARAHTHSPSSLRQRCLAVSSDPVSTSRGEQPFWTSARGERTCRTTSCLLISPLNDLNRCWAQISELWKELLTPKEVKSKPERPPTAEAQRFPPLLWQHSTQGQRPGTHTHTQNAAFTIRVCPSCLDRKCWETADASSEAVIQS